MSMSEFPTVASAYSVTIYISGPIDVGMQVIREYAKHHGLCVTVTPTTYVYSGGEEAGYMVGLINYPRFPADDVKDIDAIATVLAIKLRDVTCQWSVLVQTPTWARWYSDKPEGNVK